MKNVTPQSINVMDKWVYRMGCVADRWEPLCEYVCMCVCASAYKWKDYFHLDFCNT